MSSLTVQHKGKKYPILAPTHCTPKVLSKFGGKDRYHNLSEHYKALEMISILEIASGLQGTWTNLVCVEVETDGSQAMCGFLVLCYGNRGFSRSCLLQHISTAHFLISVISLNFLSSDIIAHTTICACLTSYRSTQNRIHTIKLPRINYI